MCSRSIFREDGEEHLSEVHIFGNYTGGLKNVFSDEEVGRNEEGVGRDGAAPSPRSHPSRRLTGGEIAVLARWRHD